MNRSPRPDDTRRQKAVLTCAACGHESPLHGDWSVTETRERGQERPRRVIRCPQCETTITSQPVFDRERVPA